MGFRSNNKLKRQLETWHSRANLLEKAAKGGQQSSTAVHVVARAVPSF